MVRRGVVMKFAWLGFFIFISPFSHSASAGQRPGTANLPSDAQKMGQQLFQQRCSVCHIPSARSTKSYGPRLYRDSVVENEDIVRETILNGRPGFMPGWKYTLQPEQVDEIIEYLKTVEKPARPKN